MKDEDVEHEIVRFRRTEIADLRAMPSASGQPEMLHSNRPTYRLAARLTYLMAGAVGLVVVAWVALSLVGSTGPVSRLLQSRVEAAVRQAMGPSAQLTMGPARLSLDGARALAVQLDDFGLTQADGGPRVDAGQLSVGVRLIPLLAGRLELANARMAEARIDLGQRSANPVWLAAISDENGLIDSDRVAPAAFDLVQQLADLARRGDGGNLELQQVTVVSGDREFIIEQLALVVSGADLSVSGSVSFAGKLYAVSGTVASVSGRAQTFDISVSDSEATESQRGLEAKVTGDRSGTEDRASLRLSLMRPGNQMDFGPRGVVESDFDLVATAIQGDGKFEIERLDVRAGGNKFHYTGAVARAENPALSRSYRFELISNESLIAPEASTEATMRAGIKLAGTYRPDTRELDLSDVRVRASSGEAGGSAKLVFVDGGSPAMKLDIGVENMDVSQVKQLWPWLAAGNARRWVMNNFFGGEVVRGKVVYDIPARRLQDKTPLNANEVSGEFIVSGSRFDTAGLLPAVREAEGSIKFAGERVDVSLNSGNAYVGEGRQLKLSNGTLAIADTRIRPLIARLDMDFSGDARTVAEVASLEPINALRGIDLAPDDLSGEVTGRVSADIPLQKGVDVKTLDWNVLLNYRNLALAKPIQGQKVDQAQGALRLQPDRATIDGKGSLNGVPAEFDLVQPIRGSAVPVKRDIALVFGDKERAALAPGLNTLMSGPAKLRLDASSQSIRKITADLTQTKLDIPWAGWSKGAGITATATLDLMPNGQVKNLNIKGKSFSARGSIDIAGGSFRSARFESLALNPGDDIALSVKRDGSTYSIDVDGASLDGRALIKQLYDQGGASSAKTTVALSASIGSLGGFNDEAMRNVKIRYRGNAAGGGASSISGLVGRNAPFSMDDERSDGGRRVSASTGDAGSLLRLLNVYTRMQGGNLQLSLAGSASLRGQIELRNFQVVNEPRLSSVVSSAPSGQSLNDATNSRIDTSRVQFERGFAQIDKGPNSLAVANAVLRGPVIGTTFTGTVYDANNRMNMSGTFLPAYGINSIFGDIPVLGAFLGGGPDGGLIGVTYRLRGNVRSPTVEVNPLSAIAPGIFRKIFEY